MSTIKLRVSRPMHVHGQRKETGDILSVEATAANSMLASGRCELLDPADQDVIVAAGRQQAQDMVRQAGRTMPPPADGPWFPLQ